VVLMGVTCTPPREHAVSAAIAQAVRSSRVIARS
jgi:hypothetical protein